MEMTWRGQIVSQMTETELRATIAQMGEHIRRLEVARKLDVERSVRCLRSVSQPAQ